MISFGLPGGIALDWGLSQRLPTDLNDDGVVDLAGLDGTGGEMAVVCPSSRRDVQPLTLSAGGATVRRPRGSCTWPVAF